MNMIRHFNTQKSFAKNLKKGIDKAIDGEYNSPHQPNTAKDDEKKSKRVMGSQRFSGC